MAQSRDEVRIDLIDRGECNEGIKEEMIIAGDVILLLIAFSRRFSC
jgi:hypothetical protein